MKKFVKFFIFWEKNIKDDININNYIDKIIKIIIDYDNIDNEDVWIINEINKTINNEDISKALYISSKDPNNKVLDLNNISKIPHWKNKKSKEKYNKEFINLTTNYEKEQNKNLTENCEDDLLEGLDDNNDEETEKNNENNKEINVLLKNNNLSLEGLTLYLNNINLNYLTDITEKIRLNSIQSNINKAFINFHINARNKLIEINDNRIDGLL